MKIFIYFALAVGVIAVLSTYGIQTYRAYEFQYRLIEDEGLAEALKQVRMIDDNHVLNARKNILTQIHKAGYKAAEEDIMFRAKVSGPVSSYSEQVYQISSSTAAETELTVTVIYQVPVLFFKRTRIATYTKTIMR